METKIFKNQQKVQCLYKALQISPIIGRTLVNGYDEFKIKNLYVLVGADDNYWVHFTTTDGNGSSQPFHYVEELLTKGGKNKFGYELKPLTITEIKEILRGMVIWVTETREGDPTKRYCICPKYTKTTDDNFCIESDEESEGKSLTIPKETVRFLLSTKWADFSYSVYKYHLEIDCTSLLSRIDCDNSLFK